MRLLRKWWHALEHFVGVAGYRPRDIMVSNVHFMWGECDECGDVQGEIAVDHESGEWWVPGRRELRHNAALVREWEDS